MVAKQFIFNWSYSHRKILGKKTESEKDKETET
jgi:hypothetical protein